MEKITSPLPYGGRKKMKKKRLITNGLLLVLGATLLVGCNQEGVSSSGTSEDSTVQKQSVIDLRSDKNQKLKIGEEMTIVFLLKDNKKEVGFRSSNEQVVEVDDFGSVKAIGEGEADVTVYVLGDENDSVNIHYTVAKSFFVYRKGYYNGQVDFSKEDDGLVKAKGDQVQMLVNECGKNWYFKAHITRTGFANNDTGGRWGVGSFLVDANHPIGNNMFWYGFRRPGGGADMDVVSYYGGWRYAKNITNSETDIDSAFIYDATKGVDVEIIRRGKMHYFCWSTEIENHQKVKMAYAVPYFEDEDTYPGVYSQNQLLDVTNFEATSDLETINQKLDEFQQAESLDINCVDNRLINGKTYQLSSTVLPAMTPNKEVSYKLYEEKEGITLTEDGKLTIAEGVTGDFRVTAVAKNNSFAKQTKKFKAIAEPSKGEGLINEGMIKTEDTSASFTSDSIKVNTGKNYFPLNLSGESWVVSLQANNLSSSLANGSIGLLSSKEGYMDYFQSGFDYQTNTNERKLLNTRLGEEGNALTYAKEGAPVLNNVNELTIIKDQDKQYVAVDGRLLGVYDSLDGETTPVLYTNNVKAEVKIINAKADANEAKSVLKYYKFFTGGNVSKINETYNLAKMDFAGNDMNWPPVNGFANGIKSKETLSGDFDISFNLSNIDPIDAGGNVDSKVLVYLNSEGITCSLQLVIKGTKSNPIYTFCPNYDDATWDEYPLNGYGIDFTKEIKVKIEKREAGCKVYFNDISILDGSDALLNDNYDWSRTSPMLPGIGTFKCGATITNPSIALVK